MGQLARVLWNDASFKSEQILIVRVDRRADPVRIARAERLDAREIRQDTISRAIEGLVEFEVVAVAVNESHLSGESKRFRAKRVDVAGIRVPRSRIGKMLIVVEVRIRLPDDHDPLRADTTGILESFAQPGEVRS